MSFFEHYRILMATTIPLVALAVWLRPKLGNRPTLIGSLILGAAVLGVTIGEIIVHHMEGSAEAHRLETAFAHLNDDNCAQPATDETQRAIHDLMCSRDVRLARLVGSADHAKLDVMVNQRGDLLATILPHLDDAAGKHYVLWALDAAGNVVGPGLAISTGAVISYARDARFTGAAEVELTAETSVGAQPSGAAIARVALLR